MKKEFSQDLFLENKFPMLCWYRMFSITTFLGHNSFFWLASETVIEDTVQFEELLDSSVLLLTDLRQSLY